MTKRILGDAAALAEYTNAHLVDDLQRELEDQLINGTGAGDDFTGLLNASIGTEGAGSGPLSRSGRRSRRSRYGPRHADRDRREPDERGVRAS